MTIWYVQLALRNMARSLGRLAFAGFAVWAGVQISFIPGTNAFFSDETAVPENVLSAGYWIPTISMNVAPSAPNGDSGFYKTTPCVTLSYSGLSSSTATIWYEFSDDGNPVAGGTAYTGACVPIPDGNPTHFQAVAVNDANPAWTSGVVAQGFKVDTVPPSVTLLDGNRYGSDDDPIELPGHASDNIRVTEVDFLVASYDDEHCGTFSVFGTIPNPSPGASFNWTYTYTPSRDGAYCFKVRARDRAGNTTDSAISEDVRYGMSSLVVLNEFMPNPVGAENVAKPGGEWVELYNKGTVPVDVGGWFLYDADDAHELEITAGKTDTGGTIVAPHGWLVVYRDGDGGFSLNNTGNDTVRLFDGALGGSGVNLIDATDYTVASESGSDDSALGGSKGIANPKPVTDVSELAEGKTWARFPDGTGLWFDPVPTPGEKNTDSMDMKRFQKYYRERCVEDGKVNEKDSVCEEDFLDSIGVLYLSGSNDVSHEDTEVILPPAEILQEIFESIEEVSTDDGQDTDEEDAPDGDEVEEQPVETPPVIDEGAAPIPFPADTAPMEDVSDDEDVADDVAVSEDVAGSEPISEPDAIREDIPTQEEPEPIAPEDQGNPEEEAAKQEDAPIDGEEVIVSDADPDN